MFRKGRKDVVLAAIFGFSNFKVKDTIHRRYLTESHSAHPNYVKNKCITNYTLNCREKFNVFQKGQLMPYHGVSHWSASRDGSGEIRP